jgi:hypothetical protein
VARKITERIVPGSGNVFAEKILANAKRPVEEEEE